MFSESTILYTDTPCTELPVMTDPLRATAALRTWNSVKFGLTHQRKPERASAGEEKPLHCIAPLIMQKIQAGGLVGEVSVKSVFDGKLVNNSRAWFSCVFNSTCRCPHFRTRFECMLRARRRRRRRRRECNVYLLA